MLGNLERLVVKPANESGGYGVLVGTQATEDELAGATKQIEDDPNRWVAQPIIPLSTAPTLCDGAIAPRHVDLRPFTLLGPDGAYVTRGGLTRVARQRGLPGGQLLPGRREQGHLGGRHPSSRPGPRPGPRRHPSIRPSARARHADPLQTSIGARP